MWVWDKKVIATFLKMVVFVILDYKYNMGLPVLPEGSELEGSSQYIRLNLAYCHKLQLIKIC